jgi:hypothetical protein
MGRPGLTSVAQILMPWPEANNNKPKQADFKAWVDHICSVSLAGQTHEQRRHLFKTLLDDAWRFSNWLTHAKASTWYDAEAATSTIEHALGLATSLVIRQVRGVPEACPACGSNRLSPERGVHSSVPDVEWERPSCEKCGWTSEPVPILPSPDAYAEDEDDETPPPEGDCILPTVRLRALKQPNRKD